MTIGEAFTPVLSAAQRDAGSAYERLYLDLAPAVHGFLRLHGAREPEDLTSEVFLGAFGRLASFSGGEEQFRSWVFTFAYRRLVDERRPCCHHRPGSIAERVTIFGSRAIAATDMPLPPPRWRQRTAAAQRRRTTPR